MINVPFTKAHGAGNDFLLTWAREGPSEKLADVARAICDRHAGIGADGWILVFPAARGSEGYDAAIRLFNSDGSEAEISGNGTRCAAALLIDSGIAGSELAIRTGAGVKRLRLTSRQDCLFWFEMHMGQPMFSPEQLNTSIPLPSGEREVTILNVGNPQCVRFIESFDFDWRGEGAAIERHSWFPNRTNVSFVRVVDEHTLDVRFFERGAGETMSSGTGATGAAVAAILRGFARTPIRVLTPAGILELRYENGEAYLTGPAEIVGRGEFYH